MPACSKADPRSYVKPVPPPIPSNKGLRIEARSANVYYTYEENQKKAWENQYRRRQQQWTSEGFQSARHKPYRGIGDPVYLGQKPRKLVLHALGQMTDEEFAEDSDSAISDDIDEWQQQKLERSKKLNMFWMRKAAKSYKSIPRELCHGLDRPIIRQVKLGQDLFHLLRKEKEDKDKEKKEEEHLALIRRRTEPQPPKWHSDTEDTSSEEEERAADAPARELDQSLENSDIALGRTGQLKAATPVLRNPDSESSDEEKTFLTRTKKVTRVKSAHARLNTVRPFTPHHSSINKQKHPVEDSDALFRQLCVLHWLLEAMTLVGVEDISTMNSIITCWKVNEMGGSHGKRDHKKETERVDTMWKGFTKQDRLKVASRRQKHLRGSHARRLTLLQQGGYVSQRSTARETIVTPFSQQSHLDSNRGSAHVADSARIQNVLAPDIRVDKAELVESEEDDEDFSRYRSQFRFLDDYYEKLRKEEGGEKGLDELSNTESSSARSASRDKGESEVSSSRRGKPSSMSVAAANESEDVIPEYTNLTCEQKVEILREIEKNYLDSSAHNHDVIVPDRHSVKIAKADMAKARNSAAVKDFKDKSTSNVRGNVKETLRQEFHEVFQSKAVLLHERLEGLEREKYRKVESKFRYLPTNYTSFHKAVGTMRKASQQEEKKIKEEQKRNSAAFKPWFDVLQKRVPQDLQEDFFIQKILDKIRPFAAVELVSPSVYKFVMVLQNLRPWEICSPDVTSAVEFCREHVIEMTATDFEDWFKEQFPKVERRPQTAPSKRSGPDAVEFKSKLKVSDTTEISAPRMK